MMRFRGTDDHRVVQLHSQEMPDSGSPFEPAKKARLGQWTFLEPSTLKSYRGSWSG
jgi:hypothetical protein